MCVCVCVTRIGEPYVRLIIDEYLEHDGVNVHFDLMDNDGRQQIQEARERNY